MSMIACIRLAAIPLFGLGLLGCPGAGPKTVDQGGEVKFDDKPLVRVLVTFSPLDKEFLDGPPAQAMSDEQGKFTLTSTDGRPGVVPGRYRVTVLDPATGRGDSLEHPEEPFNAYNLLAERKSKNPSIPSNYTSPTLSPLEVTVPSSELVLKLAK